MAWDDAGLGRALDLLPQRFKGPGGVAGVVKDGQVIARRAWGYADLTARLPMTTTTRLPICSISKQFTCAVLLDQVADPSVLDGRVADLLPGFTGPKPTIRTLCDNQSGLRDYWALTVLQGAAPDQTFGRDDALPLLARMKTGQFAPGTSYSYCNANFRIVAEVIERATGRALADLYAERIFGPAGMTTARLMPDTRTPADGVVGYEGGDDTGYFPAQNGIYWMGDAGIAASLQDMLAWEAHIDVTRDDASALYPRLSAPPFFADGTPATYGMGIAHDTLAGLAMTGHGGALRGFRAKRLHLAAERMSVVVMFNHEGDAHGAALSLFNAALGLPPEPQAPCPPDWAGVWLDPEQGLLLRLTPGATGLEVDYGGAGARLQVGQDGTASGDGVHLQRSGDDLVMRRPEENLTVTARKLEPMDLADGQVIAGRYWSDELQAVLEITSGDGAIFAGFEGLLGRGPMERMYPVARDVWVMTTRRSMDAPAPGDWTVQIRRDVTGGVTGLVVGSWLARNIGYVRG